MARIDSILFYSTILKEGQGHLHVDALRVDHLAGGHGHVKDDLGLLAGIHDDALALAIDEHSSADAAEDVNLNMRRQND